MKTLKRLKHGEVPPCTSSSFNREALVFSPNPAQAAILESFEHIPTYLFRLYAPRTVGKTTTAEVTSPAWDHDEDNKQDLFRLPPEEAARKLNDHLCWDMKHQRQCNLMSWSSSLLFVLQYGLYRHTSDHGKPSFADIYVLVLNTSQFPKGTFTRDLEVIYEFKQHSPDLAKIRLLRKSDMYFGEYLTQGRLNIDGHCSQTSMRQLIDMGLFTLCPVLGKTDQWNKWATRVLQIRDDFVRPARSTDKRSVPFAITMAQACFGSGWALPITIMLLSLQCRQDEDRTILDGFRSSFTDNEIEELCMENMMFDPESERLPELKQYREMILIICRHIRGTNSTELLNSFEKLGLAE